jgi:signal transduction histidine kinase
MPPLSLKRQIWLGTWLPWLTLVLLAWLTYVTFVAAPYSGFLYRGDTGEIVSFMAPASGLQIGDLVQSIGPVSLADFNRDLLQEFYVGVQPGETVPIVVQRNGETLTVPYVFPGPTQVEVLERFDSPWRIGVVFWIAAAITGLAVRPKDTRWTLLIAFFCISAIWLTAATKGSLTHTLWAYYILRTAVWVSVPVYWHLHWHFPAPLGRLPRWVWPAVYVLFIAIGLAEWLSRDDTIYFEFALLLGLAGSLALLLAQYRRHPRLQRDVALLLGLTVLVGLPIAAAILAATLANQVTYTATALLALLLLPFSYLLAINRRKLAGMQWRINRYISVYLYYTIMFSLLFAVLAVTTTATADAAGALLVSTLSAVGTLLLIILFETRARRWIESRLLGMRLAPEQLLAKFSTRITASLDFASLAHVLRDEVLPSLLVREAALVQLDVRGQPTPLFLMGVSADQLPTREQAAALAAESGRYRPPETTADAACPWALLPLALTLQGQTIGLWLLGRQDPDDFYSSDEITQLVQLANQTAVALSNSLQAEQLHRLYQADVNQREAERQSLARELHDGPLNDLAQLQQRLPEDTPPEVQTGYQKVISELRRIMTGLRPATLNFGLYPALRGLALEIEEHLGAEQDLVLDLEPSAARYDPGLEQHVFRIVQQACGNALQHGQARQIVISGRLAPDCIELRIYDNGRGFADAEAPDLTALLAHRHFGLAGIYERAALVAAHVQVHSTVGQGTQVQVTWPRPAPA